MDDDPSIEFDLFLVEKLGWKSVHQMRAKMSNAEWREWYIYYARKAQRYELERAKSGG